MNDFLSPPILACISSPSPISSAETRNQKFIYALYCCLKRRRKNEELQNHREIYRKLFIIISEYIIIIIIIIIIRPVICDISFSHCSFFLHNPQIFNSLDLPFYQLLS